METLRWFLEAGPRLLWKILFVCVVFTTLQYAGVISLSAKWAGLVMAGAVVSLTCLCIDAFTSTGCVLVRAVNHIIQNFKKAKRIEKALAGLPQELQLQLQVWAVHNTRTITLTMNQMRLGQMLCDYGIMEFIGSPGAFTYVYRIKDNVWQQLLATKKRMSPNDIAAIAELHQP